MLVTSVCIHIRIYIYSTNTHYHLQVSDLPLRGLCIFRQPDNLGVRCFGDGYNIVITMVLNPHKLGYNPYDYDYIYIYMYAEQITIYPLVTGTALFSRVIIHRFYVILGYVSSSF